ncbi:MAG: hypothetical protein ABII25_01445 [bacterium]
MNYKTIVGILLLSSMLFISCASIPKEAVVLNEEVGNSIASSHAVYLNLLNYYFEQRRKKIDKTMGRYTESLLNNIKQESGETKMPIDNIGDIVKGISERRDKLYEELEKTRIMLIDKINKDHLLVMQANSNITAILQSAVDMDKVVGSLTTKAFKAVGVDLKLDDVSKLLDKQLDEAGKTSGEITGTYENIRSLF